MGKKVFKKIKVLILFGFVLVLAFVGVANAEWLDVNNYSFELMADGNQVTCLRIADDDGAGVSPKLETADAPCIAHLSDDALASDAKDRLSGRRTSANRRHLSGDDDHGDIQVDNGHRTFIHSDTGGP